MVWCGVHTRHIWKNSTQEQIAKQEAGVFNVECARHIQYAHGHALIVSIINT
jgi:hypothetical protein